MDTYNIREKLQNYLEVADDDKVRAIFTLIKGDLEEMEEDYPEDFKVELDKRMDDHLQGNVRKIGSSESKKRIDDLLNR